MLPPPAPIVARSITGMSSGTLSSCETDCNVGSWSMISAASKLVPPISVARRLPSPSQRPSAAAPMIPLAGPEMRVRTLRCGTSAALMTPPSQRVISTPPL